MSEALVEDVVLRRYSEAQIAAFETAHFRLPFDYRAFVLAEPLFKREVVADSWSWTLKFFLLDELAAAQSEMIEFFEWGDDRRSHLEDNAPLDLSKLVPIVGYRHTIEGRTEPPSFILTSIGGTEALYHYTKDPSEVWDNSTFIISTAAEGLEKEGIRKLDDLRRFIDQRAKSAMPLVGPPPPA